MEIKQKVTTAGILFSPHWTTLFRWPDVLFKNMGIADEAYSLKHGVTFDALPQIVEILFGLPCQAWPLRITSKPGGGGFRPPYEKHL